MEISNWMMNDAVGSDDQTAPLSNWALSSLNQCYSIRRCAIVGRTKIAVLATGTCVHRPMFDALKIRWVSCDSPQVGIHRTMWSAPKRMCFDCVLCVICVVVVLLAY